MTLFGTDGKQIAFTVLPVPGLGRHLVPRKFVGYMLKLLDGCEGDVSVTFGENAISIEAEYWAMSGVLLAGQYPNWRGVVPQNGEPVIANREALSNALRACLPRIEIEANTDLIRLKSGAGNECQEEIEAKCKPFTLALEGRRLLSLLGALKSPLVTLNIQATEPRIVVMREDNFTGVINPLR
jgi:DNA polymerase III sliding clamp (beta) subunit (PCNA family)